MTFDLEDSAGQWRRYRGQVVVADIDEDMLLGMPWLDKYRPRVEFGPARLFHPKVYTDPIERVEPPVYLDELVEGGKPICGLCHGIRLFTLLTTDLDLQIPEVYRDLAEAFSPSKAWELPPYCDDDLAIDLESGAELSLKPIYQLSTLVEMEALRACPFFSPSVHA
jgi:hypothetical protein